MQEDPRYYYIKIHTELLVPQVKLTFSVGLKESSTIIKLPSKEQIQQNDGKVVLNKKFAEEAHIFKYQAEEIMHIDLQPYEDPLTKQHQEEWKPDYEKKYEKKKEKERNKKHKEKDMKQSIEKDDDENHKAFARVLLTPLIAHPHTRNHLFCNLISASSLSNPTREVSCVVQCQLYYLQDFSAKIQIIPISANLQRSVANVGQMKPYCKLQLQNQTQYSQEVQGGIHPKWSAFYSIKDDGKGRILNYTSVNTVNNAILNNASIDVMDNNVDFNNTANLNKVGDYTSRTNKDNGNHNDIIANYNSGNYQSNTHLKSTAKLIQPMQLGLIHEFSLQSAGSYLHLQVLSRPFPMAAAAVIGRARIHMQSSGWFLRPRLESNHKFETQQVTLYTDEDQQEVQTGQITLRTRFIFDKTTAISSRDMIEYLQ